MSNLLNEQQRPVRLRKKKKDRGENIRKQNQKSNRTLPFIDLKMASH